MILITIQNMITGKELDFEISRIPCVGEVLYSDKDDLDCEVVRVIHYLNVNPDNDSVALVICK